ncbi:hypothetical protein, partial [Candidatus Electronema sp. TJ]|uniref:hypothetical protein n=1 Tax=Candidatus Electronema sp. TJ TaxID=3401573 RepID=UPI003AA8342C
MDVSRPDQLEGTHQAFWWVPTSVSDGIPVDCLMGTLQFFSCSACLFQAALHQEQGNYPVEKNGRMCMLVHLVKLQIDCRVPL